MAKPPDNSRDAVLSRMLKTPPKPFTPKAKPKVSPRPAATKAEQAKYKQNDKTSFKPAPRKS
jgi:hypothetical protein